MTIIIFLVDTSASMNQRASLAGPHTFLDIAKMTVEMFVKMRQKYPDSRFDKHMLLTFEDPPYNIKVGWKGAATSFSHELKNLQCHGMTNTGTALKHAFDLLNIYRWQTGIDTYGQGRSPCLLEPSIVLLITDGGKTSTTLGVHNEFNLPMNFAVPGSELTREPFRWDQRLFALVLRLRGTPAVDRDPGLVASDYSPINAMCEVTGGRSYRVTSHRILMQCIESLVQKLQPGVIINFELMGRDCPRIDYSQNSDIYAVKPGDGSKSLIAWHSCRKMIYVPRAISRCFGNWPIPESFWPDVDAIVLPSRSAHPVVKFFCADQVPLVIENLPFDKYEMEPSPLTQYILEKRNPNVCWQIFIENSSKGCETDAPFGYLKANTTLTCVNMFVLPYNYPVIVPLLKDFFLVHKQCPNAVWKSQFDEYLKSMPLYYASYLKKALEKMGATPKIANILIPEFLENSISELVFNYLQRVKTLAKIEFNKLCTDPKQQSKTKDLVKVVARSQFDKSLTSHPLLKDSYAKLREKMHDFNQFTVNLTRTDQKTSRSFKNPFNISRNVLVDQVKRMRANFLQNSVSQTEVIDEDTLHSVPIGYMSNYNEHLKKIVAPLREVENTFVRTNCFGNPFKADRRMIVDEADFDLASSSARPTKRSLIFDLRMPPRKKVGPLPKDYKYGDQEFRRHGLEGVRNIHRRGEPLVMDVVQYDKNREPNQVQLPRSPLRTINFNNLIEDFRETLLRSNNSRFSNQEQEILAILQAQLNQNETNTIEIKLNKNETNTAEIKLNKNETNNTEIKPKRKKKLSKRREKALAIKDHNMNVRKKVYKEIRKPGRNFAPLFDHLDDLQGDLFLRCALLEGIIQEALRFKRRILADMLQEFLNQTKMGLRPKFEDVKYLQVIS